ncbi:MAG: Trm112 family protein [Betaproteobacteria bacterium]|nr:Trm112 family protein [Betaproteobacteria bacterium]NCX23887.1 Trm112 family protein [Betaproteobacteria bacterium]NDA20472.1 Trm112 family protein [Betaproteobacteria bacterium]NDG18002.1 Trm112 family protein [Betaproteobacteria bacterium]
MDNRLLEILACPICKNGLRHDRQALELICDHDHLAFPIRDGMPVMLVAEARSTDAEPAPSGSPPSESAAGTSATPDEGAAETSVTQTLRRNESEDKDQAHP